MNMVTMHGDEVDQLLKLQLELAKQVIIEPLRERPTLIGGFDVHQCGDTAIGVLTVFDFHGNLVETYSEIQEVRMEYLPGFLSFRELPLFEKIWSLLEIKPDVVVFDGNGIMHPRGIGLASHLGVRFGISSFGIAKSHMIGEFEEPALSQGARSPVVLNGDIVGACLRTISGVKPVFVSVGHRILLEEAVEISLRFSRYRIPELIRQADLEARRLCREKT